MNQYTVLSRDEYIDITKKRLMKNIITNENGCWLWQGHLIAPKKQYGLTSSTLDGKKKKILAHRLSYRLWIGDIPYGLCVLHSCDTPNCINPKHLFVGTAQDNMDDMKNKGRKVPPRGEKASTAKLTKDDVIRIRELYDGGMRQRDIKKLYPLASSNISYICRRITWRHVK